VKVFDELKRRNVIKATIAYIVVAWVLLQLIDTILPVFEAPPWVFKTLTFIIAIGLPIWMIFSWVYEITPEGLKKTVNISKDQSITEDTNKRLNIIIIITLIIAIVVAFVQNPMPNTSSKAMDNSDLVLDKSIAVLPFKNMVNDKGNQAFNDGQWEAILSHLSRNADLRVISRQSMEQYRESTKTAPEIAEELRVTYLLEGSVQKYGNKARITVQLINAMDDQHLWSHDYTQEVEDIFSLQSEIASNVANELEVRLNDDEEHLSISPSIDPQTYELYLSGKYSLKQYVETKDSSLLISAVRKLSEVVQGAPKYADAYVSLAESLRLINNLNEYRKEVFPDSALQLLRKAIELDKYNVEAHSGMADYYYYFSSENGYEKAAEEWQLILQLDPNNSNALTSLGLYYLNMKEFEKAVPLIFKSIKREPSLQSDELGDRLTNYNILSTLFQSMGMYEEALKIAEKQAVLDPEYCCGALTFNSTLIGSHEEALLWAKKTYEKDTTSMFFRNRLADSYANLGQWEMAEHYYRISLDIQTAQNEDIYRNIPSFLFRLGYVLWQQGNREEAKEMFNHHIEMVQGYIDNGSNYKGHLYDLACVYAFTGEKTKALNLLEQIPFWWVTYGLILNDPMLDPIRDDPSFQKIVQKQQSEMLQLREIAQLEQYADDINWLLNR
jgi:TolB-like protein/Tfp pilus assembly protein PilF